MDEFLCLTLLFILLIVFLLLLFVEIFIHKLIPP